MNLNSVNHILFFAASSLIGAFFYLWHKERRKRNNDRLLFQKAIDQWFTNLKIIPNQLNEVVRSSSSLSTDLQENSDLLKSTVTHIRNSVAENTTLVGELDACVDKTNIGKRSVLDIDVYAKNISKVTQEGSEVGEKQNSAFLRINTIFDEVQEKTEMINDIVFQTRLLSFNASVEAARAGEHGKGFSIVATEVGRLANESGAKALEINSILKDATQEVSAIVKEVQDNSSQMINALTEQVEELQGRVRNCVLVFEEIYESIINSKKIAGELEGNLQNDIKEISKVEEEVNRIENFAMKSSAQMVQIEVDVRNVLNNKNVQKVNSSRENGLSLFEWGPHLELGVELADKEHQILVSYINELVQVLNDKSSCKSKIKEHLLKVYNCAKEHFEHEEAMQERIGHKGLASHKAVHQRLLQKALGYAENLENDKLNGADLIAYLTEWLIGHIKGADARYVDDYHYFHSSSKSPREEKKSA